MTAVQGFVIVTFDLYCEFNAEFPAYRIYVDGKLMTERNYRWNNKKQYITETVPIRTESGPHYLVLENLNSESASFEIKNFKVNGVPSVYRLSDNRFVLNPSDMK